MSMKLDDTSLQFLIGMWPLIVWLWLMPAVPLDEQIQVPASRFTTIAKPRQHEQRTCERKG